MIKIIQLIKDPHVVFLNADEPDIDIAKYRVLMVDEHDGTILMVSAMDCDLDGSTTVDDLFHYSSSEIKDIMPSHIINAAAFRFKKFNLDKQSEYDHARDILNEIKEIVVSKDKDLFAFLSDKVDEHYKKV